MQLTRLVIHKYRNVVPGTTLVFNSGKNVLLGKNATGKSTLLNLLATVADSDFSALKSEAFALDYEMSGPVWQLHASVRNERKNPLGLESIVLGQSIPLNKAFPLIQDTTPLQLDWSLRFTFNTLPTTIRVNTTVSGLRVDITKEGNTRSIEFKERSLLGDNILPNCIIAALSVSRDDQALYDTLINILTSTALFKQSRFDESLGFFERMLSQGMFLRRFDAKLPFLALSPEVSAETRMRVREAVNAEPERTTFDFSNEQLQFLDAAVRQMGFSSGRLKTERIEKRLDENAETLQFGNFSFDFTREDGSAINHSLLSFGQKRLLAFHYYLDCHPDIIIADELVNGLHHHWIENCLDAIGDRQAFLTSQNPLLLDYLHFESAEQALS
ncbi:AAA family ATPase, partial [Archangium sp.]|uniref:AAA family ATPase n=1 Tax=Archangium sp. TaxID=1872627 RepID=UPI002D3B6A35